MTSSGREKAKDRYKCGSWGLLRGKWEGYHLLDFTNTILPPVNDENGRLELENILSKNRVDGLVKIQNTPADNSAFKIEVSDAVFESLAEFQDIPTLVCFLNFLKFCKVGTKKLKEPLPLSIFDKNGKATIILDNGEVVSTTLDDLIIDIKKHIKTEKEKLADTEINFFKRQIDKLTDDYFERETISQSIDTFLDSNSKGYITIRGDMGVGKSAILANLIKKYKSSDQFNTAYHFNDSSEGVNTTLSFISNLYKQVREYYDVSELEADYQVVSHGAAELYGMFIKNLIDLVSTRIQKLSTPPFLFVVDALNEISAEDVTRKSPVNNLFFIPRHLPEDIFFIVSSRGDKQQIYEDECLNISLEISADTQKKDIKNFLKNKVNNSDVQAWIKKNSLSEKQFIEAFCHSSEYTFTYLTHVFRQLNEFDIFNLPQGSMGYYEFEYQKFLIGKEDDEIKKKRVLHSIGLRKRGLSIERIAALSDVGYDDIYLIVKSWIDNRLIDKEVEDGYTFLKFSQTGFLLYVFSKLKKSSGRIVSKEHIVTFRDHLCADIYINNNSEVTFSNSGLSKRMKYESMILIIDILIQSGDLDKACEFIINKDFYRKYVIENPINNPYEHDRKFSKWFNTCFNIYLRHKLGYVAIQFHVDFLNSDIDIPNLIGARAESIYYYTNSLEMPYLIRFLEVLSERGNSSVLFKFVSFIITLSAAPEFNKHHKKNLNQDIVDKLNALLEKLKSKWIKPEKCYSLEHLIKTKNRVENAESQMNVFQNKALELLDEMVSKGIKHYKGKGDIVGTFVTGDYKIEITKDDLKKESITDKKNKIELNYNTINVTADNPGGEGFLASRAKIKENKKE